MTLLLFFRSRYGAGAAQAVTPSTRTTVVEYQDRAASVPGSARLDLVPASAREAKA